MDKAQAQLRSRTLRPSHTHLFTVRVWHEDLGDGRTEWRGEVQHVEGGEVRYFRDWQALVAHLEEMLTEREK